MIIGSVEHYFFYVNKFYVDYLHEIMFLPNEKSRGGQLSDAKNQVNKQLNKERIHIAHPIGGIKRHDILFCISRIRDIDCYDKILANCAGL